MKDMLLGGLGLFAMCQVAHIIIWRIRVPEAYPLWLLGVFVGLPTAILGVGLGLLALSGSPLFTADLVVRAFGAYVLHGALSGVYAIAYPGVIHFSPTVEIAKAIAASGPRGITASELDLPLFTPDKMIGMRVVNLIKSGMIERSGPRLVATAKGARIARAFVAFRRVLGMPELGGG